MKLVPAARRGSPAEAEVSTVGGLPGVCIEHFLSRCIMSEKLQVIYWK